MIAKAFALLVALFVNSCVNGLHLAKISPRLRRGECKMASDISMGDSSEDTDLLRERVDYFDLNTPFLGMTTPTTRQLPLFVLGHAFFPCGDTVLTVFEMKYR